MIKAVIFDMDGVLIDTEKYYIQLGMDITKEMGYEIPREVFLSMRSLNRKFSKPMLLEKYGADFDFEYFHAERRRRLREILEYRGKFLSVTDWRFRKVRPDLERVQCQKR